MKSNRWKMVQPKDAGLTPELQSSRRAWLKVHLCLARVGRLLSSQGKILVSAVRTLRPTRQSETPRTADTRTVWTFNREVWKLNRKCLDIKPKFIRKGLTDPARMSSAEPCMFSTIVGRSKRMHPDGSLAPSTLKVDTRRGS